MRDAVAGLLGPTTRLCPHCASTAHGRPRTADGVPLSLAYADGVVLVARSQGSPIGVDVEAGGPELLAWTRVEAVLKAQGTGLRRDPADVGTDADEQVATAALDLPSGYAATVAVAGAAVLAVTLRNVPGAPSRRATDAAAR